MLSDKTWRLVFKEGIEFDSLGILAWTKSPRFRRHVRSQLGGTDAKNISQRRFLAAPFPVDYPRVFAAFTTAFHRIRCAQGAMDLRYDACRECYREFAHVALR